MASADFWQFNRTLLQGLHFSPIITASRAYRQTSPGKNNNLHPM